jgi:acetyltransferase-like isoleucine patch superfamily enzyme
MRTPRWRQDVADVRGVPMNEDPRIVEWRARGAVIGEGIFVGPDVHLEENFLELLRIEDGAVLARGVSVFLHDSALNNVAGEPIRFGRVILGRNCYVGANTTILCGVEIGEGAVVGAGSLVTGDVAPHTVAYGQPAREHGPVRDLILKHRRRRESGAGLYVDAAPWRDRTLRAEEDARLRDRLRVILTEARPS